ncbi:MAG: glycosyltransferase family A protein [Patescibacteria group bacterium]
MSIEAQKSLISIIIPIYNQAEEIRTVLASILNQTYKNYEIIIVNDGSTDNTAIVLENLKNKFCERNIRFKIIQQNNQGANAARNRGAQEARGEFIIFWDADAVGVPEMLEKMFLALQNNPSVSYAYSSFIFGTPPHLFNKLFFSSKLKIFGRCGGKKFKLWPFDAEKLKQTPYIHSTSLIRREQMAFWDTKIKRLQDWDLWLTMLSRGRIGVWVPEFLFTVQTKHGTMSHWLPQFAYKFMPWLKEVKKYKEAVEIIKKKHKI